MSQASSDIPVDEDYVDESDNESSRTIASTLGSYQYRYNRRFLEDHKGTHPFPSDRKSAQTELVAHALFLRAFDDKPYIAPIEAPRNIIDLGTGTGLWASLVADWFDGSERPLANVKGVDLAPLQESSVQPNLEFEVDDITKDWASSSTYDLVHIRLLWGVIDDWPKVYAESFKHMESGGYLQFVDIENTPHCDDGTMHQDTIFKKWEQAAIEFSGLSNRRFFHTAATKQEMKDAGFVDIQEKRYKFPIGTWSSDPKYRDIGRLYAKYWEIGMEGWLMAPAMEYLKWSVEDVQNFLQMTKDGIAQRTQHIYYYAVVISAKKP